MLWIPVIVFTVVGWTGSAIPAAGVILPFGLMALFGACTIFSLFASGAVAEDAAKGDSSMAEHFKRASSIGATRGISGSDVGMSSSAGSTAYGGGTLGGSASGTAPTTVGYAFDQENAAQGLIRPQVHPPSSAAAPAAPADPSFGRWQVQMDHGNWVDFAEEQQGAFTNGMLQGFDKVEFTLHKQRYELVFASGDVEAVQRNLRTGKERRVRCNVGGDAPAGAAPDAAPVVQAVMVPPPAAVAVTVGAPATASTDDEWQVQMDDGRWIDMIPMSNTIINDAKRRGAASATFRSHGQDLQLTFADRTQRNIKTGKERQVRVKPRDGAAPGGAPPMPGGDPTNPPADESSSVLQQVHM